MAEKAQTPQQVEVTRAPAASRLLQRKCACGGSPGVDGECAGCRKQRLTLQRRPTDGVDPHSFPSASDGVGQSADLSSDQDKQPPTEARFGYDFGRLRPLHTPTPQTDQSELAVAPAGDDLEREADRIASEVTRDPYQKASEQTASQPITPLAYPHSVYPESEGNPYRQAVQAEPSEENETREDGQEDETVRTGKTPGSPPDVPQLDGLRGPGQPLPGHLRAFFEPRLGRDLGRVQLHTGPQAARAARALHAQAFTQGHDIFFGEGHYRPDTPSGRRLLAHELVHTIQQSSNPAPATPGLVQRKVTSPPAPDPGVGTAPSPASAPYAAPEIIDAGAQPAHRGTPQTAHALGNGAAPGRVEIPARADRPPPATTGPAATEAAAGTAPATVPKGLAGGAATEERLQEPTVDTSSSGALLQSLGTVPASAFGQAVTAAQGAAAQVQARERAALEASLPEMESPTGMPRLSERPEADETVIEPEEVPELESGDTREGEPPEVLHEEPSGPVPGSETPTVVDEPAEEEEGSWWDWLFDAVRRFLGRLPNSDPELSTSAGERPRVDLTGDADPARYDEQESESGQAVAARRADADAAVQADFGEQEIYPTTPAETLRPSYTPTTPEGGGAEGLGEPQALSEVVRAGVDRGAAPVLEDEVAQRVEQERQDRATYELESQEAREDTQRKIDEETERVRSEQESTRQDAIDGVEDQRQRWREENEAIEQEYADQVETQREDLDQQVEEQVRTTGEEVDRELTAAEERAEEDRRKTERDIEAKKREVEKRPSGFWARVRGAVSDFLDGIKNAINGFIDGLRRRVKQIIEGAKRLVHGLIEGARRAIVGLIEGFGEALKVVVSVALFAFPETAEKARNWIDDKVDTAVETVNEAAEGLKEFASQALDALGAALDFVLSVYQKAYNLLLDGLKFLALGLIDILERIGHLVSAAEQMPDHFMGQMSEEFLGMDLSQPLPFERAAPPAPQAAAAAAEEAGLLSPEDAAVFARESFTEDDVSVDEVAPMDPDLLDLFDSLDLREGEEREFGESDDPSRSIAAIKEEQAGTPQEAAPAASGVEAAPDQAATPGDAAGPEQEDTEAQLAAMMEQGPEGCATEKSGEPAKQEAFPENLKIGPLSVGQRARYLMDQMWKGIKNWFECNWPWLLAAVVAALAVVIVAEILTGGAITAALPAIMQLITMVMIGVALGRVAMFIGEYLTKGWDGDIVGAAKSLARGLAVGAIELVFALIFDLGAIIKAARNGLRATLRGAAAATKQSLRTVATSGRRLGRAAVGAVRAPGQAARMVGGAVVRRGKLVFQGLRGGFGRGVKSLDELAQRLFERVRFRRFKIRLRNRRIQLLGYINPWVLLADGELRHVTGIETGGSPLEVGDVITIGRREGFLVGVKGAPTGAGASAAVADLKALKPGARKSIYQQFKKGTKDDVRRFLVNKESTAQLRKGIPGPHPPNFQAHHVVPRELKKDPGIKGFLDEIAFNFEDGARNGIMLPPNDVLRAQHPQWASASLHFTSHPGYTQRVSQQLTQFAQAYERAIKAGVSPQQAKSAAVQALDQYLTTLKQGLMNGTEQLK